jgi:hypothetical protein
MDKELMKNALLKLKKVARQGMVASGGSNVQELPPRKPKQDGDKCANCKGEGCKECEGKEPPKGGLEISITKLA